MTFYCERVKKTKIPYIYQSLHIVIKASLQCLEKFEKHTTTMYFAAYSGSFHILRKQVCCSPQKKSRPFKIRLLWVEINSEPAFSPDKSSILTKSNFFLEGHPHNFKLQSSMFLEKLPICKSKTTFSIKKTVVILKNSFQKFSRYPFSKISNVCQIFSGSFGFLHWH